MNGRPPITLTINNGKSLGGHVLEIVRGVDHHHLVASLEHRGQQRRVRGVNRVFERACCETWLGEI